MDKENQNEEIARIICDNYNNGCCEVDGCVCNYNCKAHNEDAKALYELGYRKINENEVVISKAEYEHINSCYNVIRKETVREILEKVKELYTTPYSCFCENILKVAEKYGVDL